MNIIKTYASFPNAPVAAGPYSLATEHGNTVYLSGQVPLNPLTGKLVEGDIEQATEQVFNNIEAILTGLQLSLKHVIKTTVFMTDLNKFALMNGIFEKRFNGHKPGRSTVQVAALPLGAQVEIECIAIRG